MASSSDHITNINRMLKNIKSEIKTVYIHSETSGIVIVTDKVTSSLDLQTIEKYVKNSNQINLKNVETPWLPQSKSYLKIISLPYLIENMNTPLTSDVVEKILKNHIFNNILIASRLRVIKVSPKSDIAITWLDIWDTQSGSKAKGLINRCFNIGSFITTVWRGKYESRCSVIQELLEIGACYVYMQNLRIQVH